MSKFLVKLALFLGSFLFAISFANGQGSETDGFKRALWYRVDLRQKMNAPFFVPNRELSKILIDEVKAGELTPYFSDSLDVEMDLLTFLERLSIPYGDAGADSLTAALQGLPPKKKGDPDEYFPNQLYLLEVKEIYAFDRRLSRMKRYPEAITLLIPADYTPTGIDRQLATFSYQELLKKVFQDKEKAPWVNPENPAANMTFSDAFLQRVYARRLVKYQNPANETLIEMYEGKKGLANSERAILQLMEFEAGRFRY